MDGTLDIGTWMNRIETQILCLFLEEKRRSEGELRTSCEDTEATKQNQNNRTNGQR